jgi:hypothetical protein
MDRTAEADQICATEDRLEDDARWKLALRVTAAPCFKRAARLRQFLLYICQKAITNQLEDVREQEIGKAVFGRKPEYNSGEDNIVRVEARELRKRLEIFFSTDGRDELTIIRIPKGSYVPLFEPRHLDTPSLGESSTAALIPFVNKASDATKGNRRSGLLIRLLLITVIALSATSAWLLQQYSQLRRNLTQFRESAAPEKNGLWPLLFDSEHQTLMVLSDTCWAQVGGWLGRPLSLSDYLSHEYLNSQKSPEIQRMTLCNYTDMADATIVSKVMQAAYPYSRKLSIRSARTLEVQDLKTQNLILVGGPRANPWVEEFEGQLPFVDEFDSSIGTFYTSRSPHPGEPARFVSTGKDGSWEETFGTVSLLPNLNHHGNVLIIAGNVAEGTEAAGDFVCDPTFVAKLRKHLHLGTNDPIPHFQLLLKVSALPGSPIHVDYLTHRILPD